MKKLILLFVLTLSISSYAQLDKSKIARPGNISGKVVDQKTAEALPYVNIVIRDTAKKIITGGITDLEGNFKVKNIPEGVSIVEIQFIGYKTYAKQINIKSGNIRIDLGTIKLAEDATTLKEVEVRAEISTVVQKIDRKVINVGKDLTAAGATASELLNNVQSVSVDSQTGALSLRGNSNVRVLVDGKPTNISTAQLLQQIPSTSIKSIELITNPSAKYNPEGMSGIINIILNKTANIGFNGSVNTGITRGENTRYNGSLDMNYKTGNVNFYTNYGFNKGDQHNFGSVTRTGTNASLQEFDFLNGQESHLIKFGADFYISDKKTFSVYTTQNFTDALGNASTKVSQNGNLLINAPFTSDMSGIKSSVYNMNYKVNFEKKGHSLELEATFSNSKQPEIATYRQLINPSSFSNVIKNDRDNTLFNIDYTNPVTENAKVELGAEVRINKTSNMNTTTQPGFNNSSFTYDRKIYSTYFNYGYKMNKITMQLGARAELYTVEGMFNEETKASAGYKDDILSIYPSAFVTYNASEKNQWQFSYSRRVDRPSIQQVNPIREWSTPLVTSLGNPNLLPQFTNSFEVNYTRQIKGGSITVGTFFRRVNDEISTILYKDPNDATDTKQIKSDTNFDGNNRYGFEMSTNYKIANWWRVNGSLDYYSQKVKGLVANVQSEVTNTAFNVRLSNSFTATKNLRFQLFAMYRGANKDLQFNASEMYMVNTGASYRVLDGKGNFTLRVNDIFNTMKFGFSTTTPYTQHGQFQGESQSAYIGFNYRFGGGKNRAKGRRNRDNNEKQGGGFL